MTQERTFRTSQKSTTWPLPVNFHPLFYSGKH